MKHCLVNGSCHPAGVRCRFFFRSAITMATLVFVFCCSVLLLMTTAHQQPDEHQVDQVPLLEEVLFNNNNRKPPPEQFCSVDEGCPGSAMVWASGPLAQPGVFSAEALRYGGAAGAHLQLSLCCGYEFYRTKLMENEDLYKEFLVTLLQDTPFRSVHENKLAFLFPQDQLQLYSSVHQAYAGSARHEPDDESPREEEQKDDDRHDDGRCEGEQGSRKRTGGEEKKVLPKKFDGDILILRLRNASRGLMEQIPLPHVAVASSSVENVAGGGGAKMFLHVSNKVLKCKCPQKLVVHPALTIDLKLPRFTLEGVGAHCRTAEEEEEGRDPLVSRSEKMELSLSILNDDGEADEQQQQKQSTPYAKNYPLFAVVEWLVVDWIEDVPIVHRTEIIYDLPSDKDGEDLVLDLKTTSAVSFITDLRVNRDYDVIATISKGGLVQRITEKLKLRAPYLLSLSPSTATNFNAQGIAVHEPKLVIGSALLLSPLRTPTANETDTYRFYWYDASKGKRYRENETQSLALGNNILQYLAVDIDGVCPAVLVESAEVFAIYAHIVDPSVQLTVICDENGELKAANVEKLVEEARHKFKGQLPSKFNAHCEWKCVASDASANNGRTDTEASSASSSTELEMSPNKRSNEAKFILGDNQVADCARVCNFTGLPHGECPSRRETILSSHQVDTVPTLPDWFVVMFDALSNFELEDIECPLPRSSNAVLNNNDDHRESQVQPTTTTGSSSISRSRRLRYTTSVAERMLKRPRSLEEGTVQFTGHTSDNTIHIPSPVDSTRRGRWIVEEDVTLRLRIVKVHEDHSVVVSGHFPIVPGVLPLGVLQFKAKIHSRCPDITLAYNISFISVPPVPPVPATADVWLSVSTVELERPRDPARDEHDSWQDVSGCGAELQELTAPRRNSNKEQQHTRRNQGGNAAAVVRLSNIPVEGDCEVHWLARNEVDLVRKKFRIHRCRETPSWSFLPLVVMSVPTTAPHARVVQQVLKSEGLRNVLDLSRRAPAHQETVPVAGSTIEFLIQYSPEGNTAAVNSGSIGLVRDVAAGDADQQQESRELETKFETVFEKLQGGGNGNGDRADESSSSSITIAHEPSSEDATEKVTFSSLPYSVFTEIGAVTTHRVPQSSEFTKRSLCPDRKKGFSLIGVSALDVLKRHIFDEKLNRLVQCHDTIIVNLTTGLHDRLGYALGLQCTDSVTGKLFTPESPTSKGSKKVVATHHSVSKDPLLILRESEIEVVVTVLVPAVTVECTLSVVNKVSLTKDSHTFTLQHVQPYAKASGEFDVSIFGPNVLPTAHHQVGSGGGTNAAAGRARRRNRVGKGAIEDDETFAKVFVGPNVTVHVSHPAVASKYVRLRVERFTPARITAEKYVGPKLLQEAIRFGNSTSVPPPRHQQRGEVDEPHEELPEEKKTDGVYRRLGGVYVPMFNASQTGTLSLQVEHPDPRFPGACPPLVSENSFEVYRCEVAKKEIAVCGSSQEVVAAPLPRSLSGMFFGRWELISYRTSDNLTESNTKPPKNFKIRSPRSATTVISGLDLGLFVVQWSIYRNLSFPISTTASSDSDSGGEKISGREEEGGTVLVDSAQVELFVLTENLPSDSIITLRDEIIIPVTVSTTDWRVAQEPLIAARPNWFHERDEEDEQEDGEEMDGQRPAELVRQRIGRKGLKHFPSKASRYAANYTEVMKDLDERRSRLNEEKMKRRRKRAKALRDGTDVDEDGDSAIDGDDVENFSREEHTELAEEIDMDSHGDPHGYLHLMRVEHGTTVLKYRLVPSEHILHIHRAKKMRCPLNSEAQVFNVKRISAAVRVTSTNIASECDFYHGKGTMKLELVVKDTGVKGGVKNLVKFTTPEAFVSVVRKYSNASCSDFPAPWWATTEVAWTAVNMTMATNQTVKVSIQASRVINSSKMEHLLCSYYQPSKMQWKRRKKPQSLYLPAEVIDGVPHDLFESGSADYSYYAEHHARKLRRSMQFVPVIAGGGGVGAAESGIHPPFLCEVPTLPLYSRTAPTVVTEAALSESISDEQELQEADSQLYGSRDDGSKRGDGGGGGLRGGGKKGSQAMRWSTRGADGVDVSDDRSPHTKIQRDFVLSLQTSRVFDDVCSGGFPFSEALPTPSSLDDATESLLVKCINGNLTGADIFPYWTAYNGFSDVPSEGDSAEDGGSGKEKKSNRWWSTKNKGLRDEEEERMARITSFENLWRKNYLQHILNQKVECSPLLIYNRSLLDIQTIAMDLLRKEELKAAANEDADGSSARSSWRDRLIARKKREAEEEQEEAARLKKASSMGETLPIEEDGGEETSTRMKKNVGKGKLLAKEIKPMKERLSPSTRKALEARRITAAMQREIEAASRAVEKESKAEEERVRVLLKKETAVQQYKRVVRTVNLGCHARNLRLTFPTSKYFFLLQDAELDVNLNRKLICGLPAPSTIGDKKPEYVLAGDDLQENFIRFDAVMLKNLPARVYHRTHHQQGTLAGEPSSRASLLPAQVPASANQCEVESRFPDVEIVVKFGAMKPNFLQKKTSPSSSWPMTASTRTHTADDSPPMKKMSRKSQYGMTLSADSVGGGAIGRTDVAGLAACLQTFADGEGYEFFYGTKSLKVKLGSCPTLQLLTNEEYNSRTHSDLNHLRSILSRPRFMTIHLESLLLVHRRHDPVTLPTSEWNSEKKVPDEASQSNDLLKESDDGEVEEQLLGDDENDVSIDIGVFPTMAHVHLAGTTVPHDDYEQRLLEGAMSPSLLRRSGRDEVTKTKKGQQQNFDGVCMSQLEHSGLQLSVALSGDTWSPFVGLTLDTKEEMSKGSSSSTAAVQSRRVRMQDTAMTNAFSAVSRDLSLSTTSRNIGRGRSRRVGSEFLRRRGGWAQGMSSSSPSGVATSPFLQFLFSLDNYDAATSSSSDTGTTTPDGAASNHNRLKAVRINDTYIELRIPSLQQQQQDDNASLVRSHMEEVKFSIPGIATQCGGCLTSDYTFFVGEELSGLLLFSEKILGNSSPSESLLRLVASSDGSHRKPGGRLDDDASLMTTSRALLMRRRRLLRKKRRAQYAKRASSSVVFGEEEEEEKGVLMSAEVALPDLLHGSFFISEAEAKGFLGKSAEEKLQVMPTEESSSSATSQSTTEEEIVRRGSRTKLSSLSLRYQFTCPRDAYTALGNFLAETEHRVRRTSRRDSTRKITRKRSTLFFYSRVVMQEDDILTASRSPTSTSDEGTASGTPPKVGRDRTLVVYTCTGTHDMKKQMDQWQASEQKEFLHMEDSDPTVRIECDTVDLLTSLDRQMRLQRRLAQQQQGSRPSTVKDMTFTFEVRMCSSNNYPQLKHDLAAGGAVNKKQGHPTTEEIVDGDEGRRGGGGQQRRMYDPIEEDEQKNKNNAGTTTTTTECRTVLTKELIYGTLYKPSNTGGRDASLKHAKELSTSSRWTGSVLSTLIPFVDWELYFFSSSEDPDGERVDNGGPSLLAFLSEELLFSSVFWSHLIHHSATTYLVVFASSHAVLGLLTRFLSGGGRAPVAGTSPPRGTNTPILAFLGNSVQRLIRSTRRSLSAVRDVASPIRDSFDSATEASRPFKVVTTVGQFVVWFVITSQLFSMMPPAWAALCVFSWVVVCLESPSWFVVKMLVCHVVLYDYVLRSLDDPEHWV